MSAMQYMGTLLCLKSLKICPKEFTIKIIFFIADGMGDWPVYEGKTPLELAHTPTLDALAGQCIAGRIQTIPHGMPAGSDVANMGLLGFDPTLWHSGRGPVEAAAKELSLADADLIWRLNLVSVSDFSSKGTMLHYAAHHITTQKALPLVYMLEKKLGNHELQFIPGEKHSHLVVWRNAFSALEKKRIIRSPHDIMGQNIAQDIKAWSLTPELWQLIEQANAVLATAQNTTKANAVWLWGQGRPLKMPSFSTHFGLKGAVVSTVSAIKGIGKALGMEVPHVAGKNIKERYQAKLETALHFLDKGGNFVYLHIQAPDYYGHLGDVRAKAAALEDFDSALVAPLLQAIEQEKDMAVVITCDHFTPVSLRTHTKDPVPFIFVHKKAKSHILEGFSEKNIGKSMLFLKNGRDLLPFILEEMK